LTPLGGERLPHGHGFGEADHGEADHSSANVSASANCGGPASDYSCTHDYHAHNRRAHDGLTRSVFSECPNCHEPKLPHRVCTKCGKYKGREVIEVVEE